MISIHCQYDELVDPKKLKDHPKNRNKHSDDQIERLAKLYSYHGVRHSIIVSKRSGCIVAGHGRKLAAIKAKIKAPVVYQDFESDEAEYAFIQADNAIALWSELDLSGINSDLGDLGPDFDIEMLGLKNFTLDVSEIDMPQLNSNDRQPFRQMSFIVHDNQFEEIEKALKIAKAMGEFNSENENSNGNALARICETFNTDHGNS